MRGGSLSFCLGLSFFILSVAESDAVQTEYIRSSSPLKRGGTVTSVRIAGQPPRTVTRSSGAVTGRLYNETNSRTYQTPAPTNGVAVSPNLSGGTSGYPYPVATAQTPAVRFPSIGTRGYQVPAASGGPVPAANQVPTLGNPRAPLQRYGVAYRNPDCGTCAAPGGQHYSYPAASTAPTIGSVPGGFPNPVGTRPNAYQPLLRLQNMPPGVYLGQGIIGQPTAYVDGQPLRNLLRYISP